MTRFIFIIVFLIVSSFVYSQQENEILTRALCSYKKELPKLEKLVFKKLKRFDKSIHRKTDYQSIIIPIFKLKEDFTQNSNNGNFASYIDFNKIHNDFTVFIFKDSSYQGLLHLSDYDNSYFSVNDTSKYNSPAFKAHFNFARQIMEFKPDMVFFPDNELFPCFIKENMLYIGRSAKQFHPMDYILSTIEFLNKNPSFIKELIEDQYPKLKLRHYIILKNCPNS